MKIELPLVIKASIISEWWWASMLLYALSPGSSVFQCLHTIEPGMKVTFLVAIEVKLNHGVR